ncbi:MAG: cysteine--tRNA ligase, partial [Actinobacteria bacterium]
WDRIATFGRNARAVLDRETVDEAYLERVALHGASADPWVAKFTAGIEDDFNTPEALATLFDLISTANPLIERAERGETAASDELASLWAFFDTLAGVLGISPIQDWPAAASGAGSLAPLVGYLLELREEARRSKDFARADAIRDRLAAAGVVIEDRPGGPRWHLA